MQQQKNKVPRNKFNHGGKDLYLKNYRTLNEEIKEEADKWKHIPCPWIRRINIVKMSILPKATYRFNTIPIKRSMAYFTDLEQVFQKIFMELKKTLNSLGNLEKEEQGWRDHNT